MMSAGPVSFLGVALPAALAVAALVPAASAQQALTGVVRDSVTQRALPGVVLLFLDAAGEFVARRITDERGEYEVRADPRIARARALRLGFRPRDVATPPLHASGARLDIQLRAVPSLLQPIRTVANAHCRRRADSERAFALWEQARTGLLATVVARDVTAPHARLLLYQRHMGFRWDSMAPMRVTMRAGQSGTPFSAARSAADFVEHGFREREASGTFTFFGPDADVLIDEAFQARYCFSLADEPPPVPALVGLRFAPARTERNRVDIEGTLWVDSAAQVLHSIDFAYVGMEPGASRHRPGGLVHFHEMPNGMVMLDRWVLRMVSPVTDTGARLTRGGAPGRWNAPAPRVFWLSEGGGEMAEAVWSDGKSWRSDLGALRIRVVDRAGKPLDGVTVALDSTPYMETTDRVGYVQIDDVLPGRYTGSVADSALLTIGIQLGMEFSVTAVRDSTVTTSIAVRSRTQYAELGCGRAGLGLQGPVVIGRVVDELEKPLARVRWNAGEGGDSGFTDDSGLFYFCTFGPAGERVALRFWPEAGRGGVPALDTTVTLRHGVRALRAVLPTRPR